MKKTNLFAFFLLLTAYCVPILAHAENIPEWEDVTLSTTIHQKRVTVTAKQADSRLSVLTVTVNGKDIVIPEEELKKHKDPHFRTTAFGYSKPDLSQFYVSVECGILSSYLTDSVAMPYTVYFNFGNGRYLSQQKNMTPTPVYMRQ